MAIPLSVLDLAPTVSGATHADALRRSLALAKAAESFGYHRHWFAEHHFAAVASTSPDVLVGQALAATERIRVGSAAVLLGYYPAPLVVERFAILAALYPGRVDLGVGRSAQRFSSHGHNKHMAGADAPAREQEPFDPDSWPRTDGVLIPKQPLFRPGDLSARLAREAQLFLPGSAPADYGEQVDEILDLLAGSRTTAEGVAVRVAAAEESDLVLWVFGSSRGQSASTAARKGLPFVTSYHVTPATALDGAAAYREEFVPSKTLAEPYLVVSADVVVAESDKKAQELAEGYGRWVHSIRAKGGAEPYPAPGEHAPLAAHERRVVEDRIRTQFVGSPKTVVEGLSALARLARADELVVTTITHDHADRVRSYELLAEAWGR
ncbi:LLM class flavin-dependent oxidoreductase [Segniliparus rugosus]|uniref:Luciferase family oxidoreductase, group 1 n=1 Tax=Segniliparus rugosus (strain ATCC BAA-974 / DSM 45345 / CCUG 50838 / CIP 108380 / JCM 13579 / CDC 945) TaxID=679197 RepID=E5XPE9_SEGRC|nr:LLM class flavin-dependent oxidoreductase [Segniliparus rugosus]EFV13777.1 luciferase family oxidoreductase, group 1 [Segniliparus rugosus ATCC BAA-974]